MSIHIYGKDGCTDCERSKLLCQMQSPVSITTRWVPISRGQLHTEVGSPVRSLPQIFIQGDAALISVAT